MTQPTPHPANETDAPVDVAVPRAPLTPAAVRALQEAQERRRAREAQATLTPTVTPNEIGGRAGPDPVRYGDWEQGGIAWDF